MPKYFREVNKHISGDKTIAARYMSVARSMLGGLVEMSGDVFQNIRRVMLPDGTKIEVSFIGDMGRIAIDVTSTELVGVVCSRADMLRGLLIGGLYHYSNWVPSDGPYSFIPSSDVPIEIDGARVKPSVFWFQDTASAGGDWVPESELRPEVGFLIPSMYSGHMRKVVQLMHARKNAVHYRYDWEATHGCVLIGDVLWLIEISYANGVLARKLPVEILCLDDGGNAILPEGLAEDVFTSPEWVFSKSVPTTDGKAFSTGAELLTDIASGKVIRLAEASVLSDAYAKQNMFTACGWAFNTVGSEASCVCYNHTDDGYPITYLYTVNIQHEQDVPTNATMTLVTSGVVCNGMNTNSGDMSRIVFKTPSDGAYYNQLKSFDPRRIHETEGMTSHWGEEGPLHVFYRHGSMVLVMGRSVGETVPNYVETTPGYIAAPLVCLDGEYDGHSLTIENEQPSHGVYVAGHMPIQAASRDEHGYRIHWDVDVVGEGTDLFNRRHTRASAYHTYQQVITPTQVRPASAVVVPSYDREAVYCYNQIVTIETLAYERIVGPYWFETGDNAFTYEPTPDDGDDSYVITGYNWPWYGAQCTQNGPGIPSESGNGVWEYRQIHGLVGPMVSVGDVVQRTSWRDEEYTFIQEQSYDKNNDTARSTLFFLGSKAHVVLAAGSVASETNPWIAPITDTNRQMITATHSAFIENSYVISGDINTVFGADCLTSTRHNIDAPYVNQYFNRAFIGAC